MAKTDSIRAQLPPDYRDVVGKYLLVLQLEAGTKVTHPLELVRLHDDAEEVEFVPVEGSVSPGFVFENFEIKSHKIQLVRKLKPKPRPRYQPVRSRYLSGHL